MARRSNWRSPPWVARAPDELCTVEDDNRVQCGKLAKHAYPAWGGGYQSLCTEHAMPHLSICVTIEQARRGEVPECMANRSSSESEA